MQISKTQKKFGKIISKRIRKGQTTDRLRVFKSNTCGNVHHGNKNNRPYESKRVDLEVSIKAY